MSVKVREYRKNAKLSVVELSRKSGVSLDIICDLEIGEARTVTVGDMLKLSSALNKTVEEIFFAQSV